MSFYTSIAAFFFLFHIVFETLASFIKYNFSSLGKQMLGVSISNIFAIFSRGCVALYGVFIAVVIEKNLATVNSYVYIFSSVMLLGAGFSLYLSNQKMEKSKFEFSIGEVLCFSKKISAALSKNREICSVSLNKFLAVMVGTQFIAVVIAYGFCFSLPKYRLMIISCVPLVSMVGTLVTFMWVEPKLARMIDADNSTGYSASREFLRARATSFFFCGVLLPVIPLAMSKAGF